MKNFFFTTLSKKHFSSLLFGKNGNSFDAIGMGMRCFSSRLYPLNKMGKKLEIEKQMKIKSQKNCLIKRRYTEKNSSNEGKERIITNFFFFFIFSAK